jgi:uncharacterized protein (DUF362 family)
VIRVGLARTTPSYDGLVPPYSPAQRHPELIRLLGEPTAATPPNDVYEAVRTALFCLGLDAERFGSASWNPLSDLVPQGGHIVLKPNFIRHWNPCEEPGASIESVITHGSVLRAVADYAFLAAGPNGKVTIAEAPQMDCNFDAIRELVGLDALVEFYRGRSGRKLEVVDLRRESVVFRDSIVVDRHKLAGDPAGYREVDLGRTSFFEGSGLDPNRFRGADYDSGPTTHHHSGGRNAYLLSETVLSSDLIINLPKLKTHKKTGVTLALKNLVGINGDKNWLPHHSVGSRVEGGDEFPESRAIDRWRSRATEVARPLLARGLFAKLFRAVRRVETATRGESFIRNGNWHGNETTWRMCCDLNRCLYYSDREGLHLDADAPVRRVLTLLDGIVAGEGEGPLSPVDVPLGVIIAGTDPVAVDLTAIRLMGFDASRIRKVQGPMEDTGPRITGVRSTQDVQVFESQAGAGSAPEFQLRSLADLSYRRVFRAHSGWIGHIEDDPSIP